ncbi:MAG: xylulokinase [Planctomycetota bacterium]|jgi:xylulokinase
MTDVLLGIDVGTGGSKALLIDAEGGVLATATHEYELLTPRPRWTEQRPEDWWNATARSIRAVTEAADVEPGRIAAVGLTGQMHGLVLLDDAGRVLRPAILWNDQRTDAQCREIHDRIGVENVLRYAGKPALSGFTAPKVLWVQEHEPEVFEAAAHLLLPKDYVRYRLTGALGCDVADASGTLLFDTRQRRWSPELLEALEVPASWLPEVHESPVVSARVSTEGAAACGLAAGTPVVAGAGDQAAEAIGCGIVDEGLVSVTVGTSGVVFAASEQYRPDPDGRLHAYCHAVPDAWHLMGVMLSAGGSLRWFRDALGEAECARARARGVDPYEELLSPAASVPAGCEGLVFLPYLTGERTPHADPFARGAFVGLTLRHDKAHLTRAVLEGVAFGLLDSLRLLGELGVPVQRVRLSGGGARSPLWRQIMADVFDAEVATVNVTQGAAYGAALLAGVGAGVFPDVRTAGRQVVRETGTTTPGGDTEAYAATYRHYRSLYPALADEFRGLASTAE